MALIFGQVVRIKYRYNGEVFTLFHCCENRSDSDRCTRIITDSLKCTLSRASGNDRSGKDKHLLALNHLNNVVTEHELVACRVLRSENIDCSVCVDTCKVVLCQLTCKARTDNLCAVKAKNCVDLRMELVVRGNCLCNCLRLGKT